MYTLKQMAKIAIDRSAGKLEEFYADCFATDGLLLYIATRAKTLRTLRLIKCGNGEYYCCPDYLLDIITMLPMLEELEITCVDSTKLCKTIGPVCTQLKCFRWNNFWYSRCSSSSWQSSKHDNEALHIGGNMQELRSLQLIGNEMTNKGLEAILEGCPYLEFLDIRNCFNLVLNENIMTELSRIRYLKLPDNSADEYMDSIDISSQKYNYYVEGPCPCCFDPADDLDPHDDYDDYYYDTFPMLDDIYGDVIKGRVFRLIFRLLGCFLRPLR
ncbi:putative F-box/LRR-repeat protein 23 [Carex littledalei]|uniref:Putative F-box/LRR-repeat protein 23 n=1 Tax=Carex littledalei TaxID=544730 RepID=A0A833QMM6_9POAL|nr:putative F-box/LRR-repeat protein 23 [Carex littledalei]